MSFGVLVISKPAVAGMVRTTAVANLNGKVKAYSRLTDGKQGRGNAWLEVDVPSFNVDDEVQVGDIVAVPVTAGDLNDFESTGTPSVLLQKLVNAHARKNKVHESNQNIKLVVDNLFDLASSNVDALADYFSDNRGRKGKSESKPRPAIAVETIESEEMPIVANQHFYIPNWDKYKNHIERQFAGGVTEFQMLEFALQNRMNVFAMGDAGTGKTELAYWFASKTKRNLAVIQANGMTTVDDLLGQYVINPATGKLVYQPSELAQVVANGGVILVDEIFKLPRNVQSVFHSLLDDRRCLFLTNKYGSSRIDAHDDLLIIAGGNPNYKGDSALNEAFVDRFSIKVKYDYDKRIEAKIVKSDSLRDLANKMRSMSHLETFASSDVSFETPISPRLLKAFEKIAVGLNFDFAVDVFVNNFSIEEQSAVRTLIESHAFNIQEQLGLTSVGNPVSTEEV